MQKKVARIFIFVSFALLFTTRFNPAKAFLSKQFLSGTPNNYMKVEAINNENKYLFVPTSDGLALVNPDSFETFAHISLKGRITDFVIIDNIEANAKPNRDLLIFTDDETNPSVIAYSLDNFEEIWSYTIYLSGYNERGVRVESKIPVFDYDYDNETLLLAGGYSLSHLDIKTGKLNWEYKYQDNIWSVTLIDDINKDDIKDLAISVQPEFVIALNGETGSELWQKAIAQPYDVVVDDKIIGSIKTNIWDLHYLNKQIIASSETGSIYKITPLNGHINGVKEIMPSLPSSIVRQNYLIDRIVKKVSGLNTNENGTYKIINTRIINDINNDQVNEIIVTTFEKNTYNTFTNQIPSILLLDGKTLNTIWKIELTEKQLMSFSLTDNGEICIYDGKKIIRINVANSNDLTEIWLDKLFEDNNQKDYQPLIYNGYLIVYAKDLYQINIEDIENLQILNTISYCHGYDTVFDEDKIYKLYYQFGKNKKPPKKYYAIECFTVTNDLLWSYDLNGLHFSKYLINNGQFIFIDNNMLLTAVYDGKIITSSNLPSEKEILILTKIPDINADGNTDILINFYSNEFVILDGSDFNEIMNNQLGDLVPGEYYNIILPIFNDKREMYLINHEKVTIISFDEHFNITIESTHLIKDFWLDMYDIKNDEDYDQDGYNEFIFRLNNDSEAKVMMLFTKTAYISELSASWDFTIYPLTEDLNGDGKYEVLMSSRGEDEEGTWHDKFQIINPYDDQEIIFEKRFYDGNMLTFNTRTKPLAIIDDIIGEGKKNVLVLVDRWGETFIQVYNIDDNKTVKKVFPLNIQYIEQGDMRNHLIGAPGGYIDTLEYGDVTYLIMSTIEQEDVVTKMVDINKFYSVNSINKRLDSYRLLNDNLIYQLYQKYDEENYYLETINLQHEINLTNIDPKKVYQDNDLLVKWEKSNKVAFYNIYLNGKLVEVTSNNEIKITLNKGNNQIGIGEVLINGLEQITYYNIKSDVTTNTYYYYIVTGIVIGLGFMLPLKKSRYRKKGVK